MIREINYLVKLRRRQGIILRIKFIVQQYQEMLDYPKPLHMVPVLIYDKTCPGSRAYFSFTDEFLNQDKPVESAA